MTLLLRDGTDRQRPACTLFRRWIAFNAVGALGIVVQLAALVALTGWIGLNYLAATAIAVEVSVVHNFAWHERWTWSDRKSGSWLELIGRFARFNFANGALSILGNVVVMRFLVGEFGLNYLVANLIAIGACSILNFAAGECFVFGSKPRRRRPSRGRDKTMLQLLRKITPVLLLVAALPVTRQLEAAELRPETAKAWEAYVKATELRIGRELSSNSGFLALEFQKAAAAERANLLAGGIPVAKMKTLDGSASEIPIPSGMIHHWRGSVFIPGVRLKDLLLRLENPTAEDTRQEDVLTSRVLEHGQDSLKLFLKLQRSKFVTVVYNTEHLVRYSRYSEDRASSSSIATRISELENPNTPRETEKPEGRDSGFLWRLNSYWRYEQVKGGVIVECESISLSRTVPAVLEFFIRPMIDSVARESMQRTLLSMRDRIVKKWRQAKASDRSPSEKV